MDPKNQELNESDENRQDGGDGDSQEENTPVKNFTQEEVDRIVRDRLKREREKYADYDTLKSSAAELAKIREQQMTEEEKLRTRLEELEGLAKKAAEDNKRLRRSSAVVTIAGKLGAIDAQDANFRVVTEAIDPDSEDFEELVESALVKLKEEKAYLFSSSRARSEPFNPDGSPPTGQTEESVADRRARIYGRGGQIFSPERAKKKGGGVAFSPGWNGED